jgi:hypothetical protein
MVNALSKSRISLERDVASREYLGVGSLGGVGGYFALRNMIIRVRNIYESPRGCGAGSWGNCYQRHWHQLRVCKCCRAGSKVKIKAAFDGFPIFDPRPVFALAEDLFPGRGADLSDEWRTQQFECTWLRVASQHYADFWQVTQDAPLFAAKRLNI